jgi:hypothetical protein
VKFCYADSPYLGCCSYYGHNHGDGTRPFDGMCWNDRKTHTALIGWLESEYPDGWAYSASSPSLRVLMDSFPMDCRIGAWVKPFASFKPGINPGYCWEPVVFVGGRKRGRKADTVRDYVSANILLEKGTPGAKPPAFCNWIMDLMGFEDGDQMDDLFHGSGSFARARDARIAQPELALT